MTNLSTLVSLPSNADHNALSNLQGGEATQRNHLTDEQVGGLRTVLTEDLTLYVATTGDDVTGDGTVGNPWATIQKAQDAAASDYDCGLFEIVVQLADGVYTDATDTLGVLTARPMVSGLNIFPSRIRIRGNESDASAVVIRGNAPNVACVYAPFFTSVFVEHLTMEHLGSPIGQCLSIIGGIVMFANVRFGQAAQAHILLGRQGFVESRGNYTIFGNAGRHIFCGYTRQGGAVADIIGGTTITLVGTPAFTVFAQARNASLIGCQATFSGAATGKRYDSDRNGVIDVNGAGATYFPGNAAGTVSNGGIYA